MNDLKERYKNCIKCSKCLNQIKVFGSGNLEAKICVIGEGPGKDEVDKLIPFVGKAGQLLDVILDSIGIKRSDVFFTNALLCRTDDKNRSPTIEEYSNCRVRLFEELSNIKPNFTLLLGNTALCSVMGNDRLRMSSSHGKWFTHLNEPCYFYYALYHPSWILHASTEGEEKARKKIMWEDLKILRDDMKSFNDNMFNGEKVEII